MKILYFTKNPGTYTGSGTYACQILPEMAKKHTIHIFNNLSDFNQSFDIAHVLDMKHFDPVWQSYVKCPLVIDVHDYYWTRFYPFFCFDFPLRWYFQKRRQPMYAQLLQQADGIIVHSRYVAQAIDHPEAFLVRLNASFIKNTSSPSSAEKENLILFIGRDYFRKGIMPLWQAFLRVQRYIPDVKLVIIGKEYLHSKIICNSIAYFSKNIQIFDGLPNEDLQMWYQRAKVFALPSHIEAFGITILEALANGVPIVATDVGGIPEIITSEVDGLLVPPNDSKALADAILRVMQDSSLCQKLIQNGRQRVGHHFTVQHTITDLEQAYQQTLS